MDYDLLNINSEHKPYSTIWYVEFLRKKLNYVVDNKEENSISTIVNQCYWLANDVIKDKINDFLINDKFTEEVVLYLDVLSSDPDSSLLDDVYKNIQKIERSIKEKDTF